MDDDVSVEATVEELGFWDQHRYLILIGLSIVMAVVLVSISMHLYTSSGASQLDLSRPGYSSVAEQVKNDSNSYQQYSAIGDINKETIGEFEDLFNEQSAKASAVDAFGGDPLNPDALEISAPKN